jgi:hypothetical protein
MGMEKLQAPAQHVIARVNVGCRESAHSFAEALTSMSLLEIGRGDTATGKWPTCFYYFAIYRSF